jgi:adenosine/AMP kinase
MEIKSYKIENDGSMNIILGQSHFIKTVEDLYEIMITSVPGSKFGIAFCEASGPALIRSEGNDHDLVKKAEGIMQDLKAGHSFVVIMKDCYPINVLSKIKHCDEVVNLFCASANPLTILTVENKDGAGIIGVIDGISPKGVETADDRSKRKEFLRTIGYKF